jgi:hypothetical protein
MRGWDPCGRPRGGAAALDLATLVTLSRSERSVSQGRDRRLATHAHLTPIIPSNLV